MLTGKMVRVRHARNKLVPIYLDPRNPEWLAAADQLIYAYQDAPGHTRGELDEALVDLLGDGPAQLIHQGLAKLLEDRCDFEVAADLPPDTVREAVFRLSAVSHAAAAKEGLPFNRDGVLHAAALELGFDAAQIDQALFADLKDEQRVLTFDAITPEQLLHRYNVALAQAILARSVRVEVRVWGESVARFRQLFRAVKFHRLMATIRPAEGQSYKLLLDGPMSLFSATQKYGGQLAAFLPSLLHCKTFELRAEVRWGAERKEKLFSLAATDGLRSHAADFGMHVPREVTNFADNFRSTVEDWTLADDPNPIAIDGTTWLPDFTLTHVKTGHQVYAELLGFWRKLDIEAHYRRLRRGLPGKFVLVVSEAYRTDDAAEFNLGEEVYRFKRTPVAAEVAKAAGRAAGLA